MVVTFMVLLELIKMGTVTVAQAEHFGDITCTPTPRLVRKMHAPVEP